MKYLNIIGTKIFDYLLLTVLLIISSILIIPIIPVYIGMIGYYGKEDSFKTIFKTIKENFTNILYFTLISLLIFISLYLTTLNKANDDYILIIFRLFVITIFSIFLMYVPILVVKMKLTFKELILNSFIMFFSKIKLSIIMLSIIFLFIFVSINELLALILLFVPFIKSIQYLSEMAFNEIKKKQVRKDDNLETN